MDIQSDVYKRQVHKTASVSQNSIAIPLVSDKRRASSGKNIKYE